MTTDKNHSPAAAPMWWDGGDRAITAREKATIEEHGPSCYTIPLLPAQAVDPADPWRGLYLPARMPAPSEYGDLTHPDIPRWPDDREDALDKLVHAQGFDFHIVAGDFTEEAMEDGDELYWQELRAWNPEAPEGEWRLAWKGDTEDGPYAWFVRPMALRPEPVALAATGKQVGEVQGDALSLADHITDHLCHHEYDIGGRSELLACVTEALAARQPGAQVPLCFITARDADQLRSHDVTLRHVATYWDRPGDDAVPVYLAPPAQGIDLGQLSVQHVAALRDMREHMAAGTLSLNDWRGFGTAALDAVLALIDQRDAAPGVGNG